MIPIISVEITNRINEYKNVVKMIESNENERLPMAYTSINNIDSGNNFDDDKS